MAIACRIRNLSPTTRRWQKKVSGCRAGAVLCAKNLCRNLRPKRIPAWGWMLTGKITGATKGVRWPFPIIRRDTRQRGIIGCNMAFWREDILAVNGFDEDYTGWGTGEDSDIGTRLYHLGRPRKFVYGRAITFHLNHPAAPRDHHAASLARLAKTIASGKIRCENGLDRHLGDHLSPVEKTR